MIQDSLLEERENKCCSGSPQVYTVVSRQDGSDAIRFEELLMKDGNPTMDIRGKMYHVKYIYAYMKDILLKKDLNKRQIRRVDKQVEEFKTIMTKVFESHIGMALVNNCMNFLFYLLFNLYNNSKKICLLYTSDAADE